MTKLIVLRLNDNSSNGMNVTMEASEEGNSPTSSINGFLPPPSEVIQAYDEWLNAYQRLGTNNRGIAAKVKDKSDLVQCLEKADILRSRLNELLKSPGFADISARCWLQLDPNQEEEVHVLICTDSDFLRKLPWKLWKLIDEYPKAGVAVISTEYNQLVSDVRLREPKQIEILGLLGDSTGIDVEKDRQVLENISPDEIRVTFLNKPRLEDISNQLWEKHCKMLFYSGHSQTEGDTVRLYINKTESITIDQLKRGLEKMARNGLQLLICNSCDGLGLLRALKGGSIPHIIVMSEPVDDLAAQKFLEFLLQAFIKDGESLHLAVRTAQQRLEELKIEYPCASLLPVYFQHAAAKSLTYNQLRGVSIDTSTMREPATQLTQQERDRQRVLTRANSHTDSWLKQSLHYQILLNLHKESQRKQVKPLQVVRVKINNRLSTQLPLPTNTQIIEFFDQEAKGKLLILGAPGSGKTTTLVELASKLIARAQSDPDEPLPVVLELSSWKENKQIIAQLLGDDEQTIAQWLVAETAYKYDVSKASVQQWLDEGRLLPLLDGLDELKVDDHKLCIEAINQFVQDYRYQSLVVCCRLEDYKLCHTKLPLNEAICLQPLSVDQIQQYLEQAKQPHLLQSILHDSTLREQATSPLLLGMMMVAFQEISLSEWQRFNSPEERRQYLLNSYIYKQLSNEIQSYCVSGKEPSQKQTIHWLGHLAKMLEQEAQTEFLIEEMQPDWLQNRAQMRFYQAGVGLVTQLIYSLVLALGWQPIRLLVIGLNEGSIALPLRGLLWGVVEASILETRQGLIVGILWAIVGYLCKGGLRGIIGGLILGPSYFLTINLIIPNEQTSQVTDVLLQGLVPGLVGGLIVGWGQKIRPFEILGWSWKKARFYSLIGGVIGGILFILIFLINELLFIKLSGGEELSNDMPTKVLTIVGVGLFFGLFCGILVAVIGGITRFSIDTESRVIPNQGIRRSAANAVISFASIIGLFCVLVAVIMLTFKGHLFYDKFSDSLYGWLLITLIFPLVIGFACIQHFILRAVLCWCGLIPWDYARFLDYAAEKRLLLRVGGRYRFIHDLLREHFAQM